MIVTTTHDIQGKMISDYLGIVVGEAIIATNIFRDIGAGFARLTRRGARVEDGHEVSRLERGRACRGRD